MRPIPEDDRLDSSLALMREGYGFIRSRCERLESPVFRTRLLLQDTLCLSGTEAARLFYDESRFVRAHAAPRLLKKTLFGVGGVQGLDGEAHRRRKALFLAVLDEAQVAALVAIARRHWLQAIEQWSDGRRIVLLEAVQLVLTRAVCEWAAVPLPVDEAQARCQQLAAMIDGAGGVAARHWQARRARREAEAWAASLIEAVRSGRLAVDSTCALARVASYTELDGDRLPDGIAAVELLNLLRPTVAVARFILYAALELHERPEWHERLRQDEGMIEPFAQEVRRLYAFFPFVAARVRDDFEWNGFAFPKGTRVLLDLFGTNRDARTWTSPDRFDPERFLDWNGDSYSLVTQGGADARQQHRCPGERLAIELLKDGLRILTREMSYRVPPQDLRLDPGRMPAEPPSRLVLDRVERCAGSEPAR